MLWEAHLPVFLEEALRQPRLDVVFVRRYCLHCNPPYVQVQRVPMTQHFCQQSGSDTVCQRRMDGQAGRRTGCRADRRADGRTGGRADRRTDGRSTDERTDERSTDGQTDRRTDVPSMPGAGRRRPVLTSLVLANPTVTSYTASATDLSFVRLINTPFNLGVSKCL